MTNESFAILKSPNIPLFPDSTNFPFGEDCIARTFIEKFDITSISVARLSPEPERMKVFVILIYQTGFKGEDGI